MQDAHGLNGNIVIGALVANDKEQDASQQQGQVRFLLLDNFISNWLYEAIYQQHY